MIDRVTADVKIKIDSLPFLERTLPAIVRLIIEAMREPPKGFEKIVYHGDYGDDVWRDSIDEVLKGEPVGGYSRATNPPALDPLAHEPMK